MAGKRKKPQSDDRAGHPAEGGVGDGRVDARSGSTVGIELVTGSVDETHALGERLGRLLGPGDVVAMSGELGSGKTTLVQGIAKGLGRDPASVKSPTFVLMREYPGEVPVIHIDGYRLDGANAASWLDLDLIFSPRKVTLLEWAERFGELLPGDRLELSLSHVSAHRRRLQFAAYGLRAAAVLARLQVSGVEALESKIQNPKSKISSLEDQDGHSGD